VSGFGYDLHEFQNSHDEIAIHLASAGLTTVQFSFAGLGKSTGNFGEMTIQRQAIQLTEIVAWVKKTIHPKAIGVLATSFGAATALAANTSDITSFVFVSGGYFPADSLKKRCIAKGVYNPAGDTLLPRSNGSITIIGKQFWPSIAQFNAINQAQTIKQPILFIHGEKDELISTVQVEHVFEAITSRKKQLKIITDGDHGIINVTEQVRNDFLQEIVQWFKQTL
jgi:alpha-beta hydrolase superfamily lysophospholipase